MMKLNETNWHRLLKMYHPTGFVIISACREENTPKENKEKTIALYKDLNNAGFKPIPVSGGWIENIGTKEETPVGEASFFVPFFIGAKNFGASEYDRTSTVIFYKKCKELGTKYKQESILYCPPNGRPRYVQTTEKDYGEGPVAIGTTTMKFDRSKIGDNRAAYFTDLTNPKKQGGYNPETGKFMKAPRRVTFESSEANAEYERIFEANSEPKEMKVTGPYNLYIYDTYYNSFVTDYFKNHKDQKKLVDFAKLSGGRKDFYGPKEVLEELNDYMKSRSQYWDGKVKEESYVPPKVYPEGTRFSFGIAIEPGQEINEDYYKWERAMERTFEGACNYSQRNNLYDWCKDNNVKFTGLHRGEKDEPRHNIFMSYINAGYKPFADWLEKHPMPAIYKNPGEIVEDPNDGLLFALYSDGGNCYSSRANDNWYWTTNEDEYEGGFTPRTQFTKQVRNIAKRHAEKNYWEYDPSSIKVKIFTSVDAFVKAAEKVGMHPNVDKYKN